MAKPKTVMLVTREMQARCFAEEDLARIDAATDLRPASVEDMTEDAQQAQIAGAEVAITGWGSKSINDAMLAAAPGLKLVCHAAGSVKGIVGEAFQERGIRVSSARAALAVGVAEFAFGMMLVSMKGVWQLHVATLAGTWDRTPGDPWIREPYGATVGIVGASCVGREMIRLCKTLRLAAILLYDPYVAPEQAESMGVELVALDELMRRSDVVSLHTPKTDETHHIINGDNLALMRDGAIFINTARGACVDEPALIAELRKGRILACLDVTDPEPPEAGNPLYALPNCILTPHVAGAVRQNCRRQGKLVADEIEAYVSGRPIEHEVDLNRHHHLA